jgi:hypothetical protein
MLRYRKKGMMPKTSVRGSLEALPVNRKNVIKTCPSRISRFRLFFRKEGL